MAYKVEKIDPLDLQPRKAIGVSLPFSARGVFNSTYQSKDAIKSNLINFLLTGNQERFLNPNFGAGLRELFFEQITETRLAQVKAELRENLSIYFPRVNPIEIQISSAPDTNTIVFFLRYQVVQTNIEDEITINIEQ